MEGSSRGPEQTEREGPSAWRIGVLVATAILAAVALGSRPPIPQDPAYFQLVDRRTLLGIPNACNVLSNLAFAIVGLAGLRVLLGRGRALLRDPRERAPWVVFFLAVALTSAGSAWFHLAPSNATLVWDRLPMAVGFMALLTALVAERIDARAGPWLLGPMVLAGVGSVLYWFLTERAGAGDLRPYLFVQFYPMVAIPLVLLLFPRVYDGSSGWIVALAAYALAKVAEVADARLFALGAVVSGHTLKHLLAAAGIGALARMLARRRLVSADPALPRPRPARGSPWVQEGVAGRRAR